MSTDDKPTFALTFGAALEDGTLYVSGVALDLEERDVLHTVIWERYGGAWNRYQWKNRTEGVVAYRLGPDATVVYVGLEGTLKVRGSARASSEEVVETQGDGPSTLRGLSGVRIIDDHLYVTGMRRMVYRRPLAGSTWSRYDAGLRLSPADLRIAGLNSIDGLVGERLHAVGMHGEIWTRTRGAWALTDSPTNLDLFAIRYVQPSCVLVAGELGALFVARGGAWSEIDHDFRDETFTCIEVWRGRVFVCADSGRLFELTLSDPPALLPVAPPGDPRIAWIASTAARLYFVGSSSIVSLGDDGWRDESPPQNLLA